MTSEDVGNRIDETSLRKAALIAGFGILIMVIAGPFAEFYAYGSLIVSGDPAETVKNITNSKTLFLIGLLSYLLMFICDFIVAWALYILLKPVDASFSLLTAWFRLIFGIIAIVGLFNLVKIVNLINPIGYLTVLEPEQLDVEIMMSVDAFSSGWNFEFIFFSIHLVLLGYLVFKSGYIPKIIGILLIINGLGYLVEYFLAPILFPNLNTSIIMVTFFGEIIFMIWLLIKGFNPKRTFSQVGFE